MEPFWKRVLKKTYNFVERFKEPKDTYNYVDVAMQKTVFQGLFCGSTDIA